MKAFLLFSWLWTLSAGGLFAAADAADPGDCRELVRAFFASIEKGKDYDAVADLFGTNPDMFSMTDEKFGMQLNLERLAKSTGAFRGFDVIRERKIGQRIFFMTVFAFFADQPIKFEFTFYRPNDTWGIFNLHYNGEILPQPLLLSQKSVAQ